MSADGRYVAFTSDAGNLVNGDTNDETDIFVYDRQTRQISRVSVASDGAQANGISQLPAISADGRYVAFVSAASNLVIGDTNWFDVFVHDRQTGQTTLVSVASDGTQANDLSTATAISGDGRYVAFESKASNLVPNDTNGWDDIFVHDRQTGQTVRVSVASDGTQANGNSEKPAISADGRYVAFQSWATNLVDNDNNGIGDVFVHDRLTGETTRVSVASDGTEANSLVYAPAISGNGQLVAFNTDASNLVDNDTNNKVDVYVHDRQTGQTSRISVTSDGAEGDDHSHEPALSFDGRYVAFQSNATNLIDNDTNGVYDVFVHDRQTGQTIRVSLTYGGTEANGDSVLSSISADGRYVAFTSFASNLVRGDFNGYFDIFVRDRGE
ncbi:MAG: PD40 domain-containing protein [Ardenticatenales bacterium]|nr:PD40 domain-containing protein [Ardenticatenales bacterium]